MRKILAVFCFVMISCQASADDASRDKEKVFYLAGEVSQLYFFGTLIEAAKSSCGEYKSRAKAWSKNYKNYAVDWVSDSMHDLFSRTLDMRKNELDEGVEKMILSGEHAKVPGVNGTKNNCAASLYLYIGLFEKIQYNIQEASKI